MKKILIVEDDIILTRLYQYVFEREGFQVEVAGDGESALKLLDTAQPDLVVVDLMLPKVHGIEVIRQVRTRPAMQVVPIIVFSNSYLSTMVKAAQRAGATMCLTKADCTPEQLLEVVRKTLTVGHAAAAAAHHRETEGQPEGGVPAPSGAQGAAQQMPNAPAASWGPSPPAQAPAQPPPFAPPAQSPLPAPAPPPAGLPAWSTPLQVTPPSAPAPAYSAPPTPAAPPSSWSNLPSAPAYPPSPPTGSQPPPAYSQPPPPSSRPAYPQPPPPSAPQAPAYAQPTPASSHAPLFAPGPQQAAPSIPVEVATGPTSLWPAPPQAQPAPPAYPATPPAPSFPAGYPQSYGPPQPRPGGAPAMGREAARTVPEEIRRRFIDTVPQLATAMRTSLPAWDKRRVDTQLLPRLFEFYQLLHSLTTHAGLAGLGRLARVASALEALLKEIFEDPESITPSSLRTIGLTLEFLLQLFQYPPELQIETRVAATILVVDDEPICRRMVCSALELANLSAISIGDPLLAFKLLEENAFDLVFLDVDMPGMSGFELCAKLRTLPKHQKTAVVFVTSLSDFESRARSTLSGANDLIAKPFLLLELAVKALTYVMKSQLEGGGGPTALPSGGRYG